MLLKACKTFRYSVEKKRRSVVYVLYMAVEKKLHSFSLDFSFKQFTKFLPFVEVKQWRVRGGNLIIKYMVFFFLFILATIIGTQIVQRPFPKITALSFLLECLNSLENT